MCSLFLQLNSQTVQLSKAHERIAKLEEKLRLLSTRARGTHGSRTDVHKRNTKLPLLS